MDDGRRKNPSRAEPVNYRLPALDEELQPQSTPAAKPTPLKKARTLTPAPTPTAALQGQPMVVDSVVVDGKPSPDGPVDEPTSDESLPPLKRRPSSTSKHSHKKKARRSSIDHQPQPEAAPALIVSATPTFDAVLASLAEATAAVQLLRDAPNESAKWRERATKFEERCDNLVAQGTRDRKQIAELEVELKEARTQLKASDRKLGAANEARAREQEQARKLERELRGEIAALRVEIHTRKTIELSQTVSAEGDEARKAALRAEADRESERLTEAAEEARKWGDGGPVAWR